MVEIYRDEDRDDQDYLLVVETDPAHEPGSVSLSVGNRCRGSSGDYDVTSATLSRSVVERLHAQLGEWLAQGDE